MTLDRSFCLRCGSISSPGDALCTRCGEPLPQDEDPRRDRMAAAYWAFVLLIALAAFAYIAIREAGVL